MFTKAKSALLLIYVLTFQFRTALKLVESAMNGLLCNCCSCALQSTYLETTKVFICIFPRFANFRVDDNVVDCSTL